MFHSLLILQAMAAIGGVGVSMTNIDKWLGDNGYAISRYRMRAILKDLQSVGAIGRNKNHFFLRLLGANLSVADQACASGYGVSHTECMDYMPQFQTEAKL